MATGGSAESSAKKARRDMADLLLETIDDNVEMNWDEKKGIAKSLVMMMREQQAALEHQVSEQKMQIMQQAAMFEKILERFNPVSGSSSTLQPVPGVGPTVENHVVKVQELVVKGKATNEEWCRAMQSGPEQKAKPTHDQQKIIRAAAAEFKEKLHKLLNVEQKLESIKEKQTVLNEEKTPPGIKPYAQPWDYSCMDEICNLSGKSITIPVP
jgi:hypothetical protein